MFPFLRDPQVFLGHPQFCGRSCAFWLMFSLCVSDYIEEHLRGRTPRPGATGEHFRPLSR